MKTSVRKLLICVGCIILTAMVTIATALGVVACNKQNVRTNHPSEQRSTTWATENGEMEFYVNGGIGHGIIQTENGPVPIVIQMSTLISEVRIYHEEEYQQMLNSQSMGFGFAQGWGIVRNNHKFVIEITAADEYFAVGKKLVFYKVE